MGIYSKERPDLAMLRILTNSPLDKILVNKASYLRTIEMDYYPDAIVHSNVRWNSENILLVDFSAKFKNMQGLSNFLNEISEKFAAQVGEFYRRKAKEIQEERRDE